uniref:cell cycle control protein 50A-like n=1 Tax=Myxine glutinosa TaxID=7769 RepID=UPI00358E841F
MATSYNKEGNEEPTSKRPDNTAFKQQRLPAWQPILTAGTVLPAFFVIAIIFIPLGIGLLITSNNIREKEIDYTDQGDCNKCANSNLTNSNCTCKLNFTLEEDFEGQVYMYYGLSNFYQNHRRYVKSRDDNQLYGVVSSLKDPSSECAPYATNNSVPYAPCGAIANSMFNDTLKLYYQGKNVSVPLLKTGIAWWTDKNVKFQNPPQDGDLKKAFDGTQKPLYWSKPVYELDPTDQTNNGFINEDFIVWMRTAALPTFRKLYRRVNISEPNFVNGLPAGNYVLHIDYNYPVKSFNGKKRMILSTTSWMGGKNPFLGIAYITVGSICFVLGVVLFIIHQKYGKRSSEFNDSVNQ